MKETKPVIIKTLNSPLESTEVIGIGNETRFINGAVERKVHKTDEGAKYYAEKPIKPRLIKKEIKGEKEIYSSEKEAQKIMRIYKDFKSFDLPVLDLFKIRRFKDPDGKIKYSLVMQDLTENGIYRVTRNSSELGSFVILSDDPVALLRKMVEALAVIHNNGYYEFHPTVSFCARQKKTKMTQLDEYPILPVDFRVIDYSNFSKKDSSTSPSGFKTQAYDNFHNLIIGLGDHFPNELKVNLYNYYEQLRKSGVKTFTPD